MEYCREQIRTDCEELLSRFQQTESVRFEIFSTMWKEMNFSEIFLGTIEGHETRLFSREILATACTFFLPPFTFQIRTGALYLLYGLYNSQLAQPREKIRFALKHWNDVKKFEQEAANAQHFDAVYILRKLISVKAMQFTAMPKPLAFLASKKGSRTICEDFVAQTERPYELVSGDMLEELNNVHLHYEKLKASAIDNFNEPGSSLNLIQKDLVPRLRSSLLSFQNWQKQKCSRRAELLASIKSKSYGQTVEASKARRHRQVE
ncbi:snRNA-activating protein complex subunit 1b, partial [Aplochiton taeniatus]